MYIASVRVSGEGALMGLQVNTRGGVKRAVCMISDQHTHKLSFTNKLYDSTESIGR